MATIPLMSDQDPELGELPSYDDVQNGRSGGANANKQSRTPKSEKKHGGVGGLFSRHFDGVAEANSVAMANISIRMGFLRKVLGILAFQFIVTVVVCTALYMTPMVRGFVQQQPWIPLSFMFASIGVLIAMFIYAYTVPLNYFLLAGWTILQSLTVGTIVTFYDVEVVLQAVLLTAIVVASLFYYALQSKHDFRKHYALIFTLSIVFLFATAIQMILMPSTENFVVSLLGAALVSVYLVVDIDMIMHRFSEEEYIVACICLYMDIIEHFLRIFRILYEVKRK